MTYDRISPGIEKLSGNSPLVREYNLLCDEMIAHYKNPVEPDKKWEILEKQNKIFNKLKKEKINE